MTSYKSAAFSPGALDYRAIVSELTTKLSCELHTDTDTSNRSASDTSTNLDHDTMVTLEEDDICMAFFQINLSQNNGGGGAISIALSATLDGGTISHDTFSQNQTFYIESIGDLDTGRGVYSQVFSMAVENVAGDVTFLARVNNVSSGDSVYIWFSEWNLLVTKRRKFHDRLSA